MKFLSALLLLSLPFSLLAEDSEWFIGIDGGATSTQLTNSTTGSDNTFGPEYGLKVGLREKNSRIYLGYTAADSIGQPVNKTQTSYLALEGVSDEFKVVAKSTAKFFLGVRLGASIADVNTDVNNTSTAAFMGGFQTGLIFLLPADFEIELAYRHYWTFKESGTDFNAGSAYGGLNYKFYAF
ncbi:MAG: hypothetical protein ABFR02_00550 [Campylobacterota bacterium]